MKKTGICPKCESSNIIKVKYSHNSKIFVGFVDKVRLSKYVCTSCGYIEEWIEDDKDLVNIQDEYSE